jgi:hypothetical protein
LLFNNSCLDICPAGFVEELGLCIRARRREASLDPSDSTSYSSESRLHNRKVVVLSSCPEGLFAVPLTVSFFVVLTVATMAVMIRRRQKPSLSA